MSITVRIEDNESIRVIQQSVTTETPDRIEFVVEGAITVTEELLGDFAGSSLKPVRIRLSIDESGPVEIDLRDEASLRLQAVDVGIETPDTNDIAKGIDPRESGSEDGVDTGTAHPGAIAFTIEGSVTDVPERALESVTEPSTSLESITFAIDELARSDGGTDPDVVLKVSLLGYHITVFRDGRIDIGPDGPTPEIELS